MSRLATPQGRREEEPPRRAEPPTISRSVAIQGGLRNDKRNEERSALETINLDISSDYSKLRGGEGRGLGKCVRVL